LENADLILVAREPSQDELNAAFTHVVNLDVRSIARDGFVFLVHADNPVQDLSLEEIRGIYTGRITNWVQVGGLDAEIHTYKRNPNSGSQELMERLVMRDETMLDSPDMMLESMIGPINAISTDPFGIGYSVYFYAENMYPDENVALLSVDGIQPGMQTIAEQSYSLTTDVFAVTREGTAPKSPALILRDWLLTKEGQFAIQQSGYVPLGQYGFVPGAIVLTQLEQSAEILNALW
jgi:phosphate transport system substrate-binding protein